MLKTFYNWIRYHYRTIQFAEWLLVSPFFLKSPFYQVMIKRGVRRTRNRPVELLVELTNSCNLACLTCPHSKMQRGRGVMSLELFRKIIDQAADLNVRSIKLAGLGEPLLDKDIADKIAYAKKKKLSVKMFTNGMLLNRQKAQQLVGSGVDEIFISVDGGSQAVQERLRKGSNFSQIHDNLSNFKRLRQEMKAEGKKIPEVIITVTYQEANKSERKLIIENWGNLVDRIRLFPIHNWNVDVKVPRRASEPCHLPFFQMAICWDGRVALCCIDYECHHQLGNVTKESISSVWQGDASMEVRKSHLARSSETITLCNSCSMLPNWFFSAGL
jgi:MoaA/NifB/PqqE/SkfB family radical SAM enzyme